VVARDAHADPSVPLTIAATDLAAVIDALPVQPDEPIGLVALARYPKLGLDKGDVIRAINGTPAAVVQPHAMGASIVYLEVVRGQKPVIVRLQIREPASSETVMRTRLKECIAETQQGGGFSLSQVTKDGEPWGVLLGNSWPVSMASARMNLITAAGQPVGFKIYGGPAELDLRSARARRR
jgi:hypothetical protein